MFVANSFGDWPGRSVEGRMTWREMGWFLPILAVVLLTQFPWSTLIRWVKEEAKSKKEVV